MSLSPGVRLGPYEVLSLVGVGGMGEVYRARDTRLKRDVAVKVLPRNWADDGDRLGRFQREAELLAALNHPNIAAIYGIEEAIGFKALILEMVEGPTLADRLAQGRVPLRDALAITRQLVDALDAAHERGIVHRDLKPANIKVRDDGTVKVLDFGLAKAFEPGNAQSDATTSPTMTSPVMTGVGVILGTAAYMSPEQARAQHVDKRSDIWAFGCVLYDMLVGQPAFPGATVADTIAGILSREPDWSAVPASMPASMVNLLRRCLDKDRKRRLRDIGDARHELDVAESDADRSPHAASTRLRWMAALTGAAIAASVLALSVVLWNRTRAAAPVSSIGPTFTRLTRDDRFSLEPALSRDGTLLIYASDRAGDGQLDLWLQRTAGGPPLRLTDDPADDREPDISPDGSVIAFRSNRGSGGIYVMPTLSGDARPVAEDGRRPRFSPDGTHIAYHTGPWLSGAGTRAAGFAVFTVATTGGQPTRLADRFTTARSPLWSADGRHVLLFGRPDGKDASAEFDWWWIPVDGGAPVATGRIVSLPRGGCSEGR
jgi:eukaryotic-like serine/threonine-protein kinase